MKETIWSLILLLYLAFDLIALMKPKNLLDVGLEMEGGIEAKNGPLTIYRNIKGSIGVESGVQ